MKVDWEKLTAEMRAEHAKDATEHWFGTLTGICTGCGATRHSIKRKRDGKYCPRPWRGNPPNRIEVPDFTKEKP